MPPQTETTKPPGYNQMKQKVVKMAKMENKCILTHHNAHIYEILLFRDLLFLNFFLLEM